MSQMELPLPTQRRIPLILSQLLEGKTHEEIALACQVTRKTIERDLKKWRQSPAFEDWLRKEWLRLHTIVQEKHPIIAYKELTKLMGKQIIQRIEAKAEYKEERQLIIKMWKPEVESSD